MPQSRAIVWISNSEASVFRFGDDDVAQDRLRADAPYLAVKHKSGAMQTGNLSADLALIDRVVDALRGTRSWRLSGPDGARDYLLGYLEQYKNRDGHIARLLTQLAGVVTLDRPSDATLLDQARQQQVAA
jgi:hypothetical protein